MTKIRSIALGEWNKGTYYFDDIYLAQYSYDGPPAIGENTLLSISVIDDIEVSVEQNKNFFLPGTVTAKMSDGSTMDFSVVWDKESVDTSKSGTQEFIGTVDGYDGTFKLTLTVTEVSNGNTNTDSTDNPSNGGTNSESSTSTNGNNNTGSDKAANGNSNNENLPKTGYFFDEYTLSVIGLLFTIAGMVVVGRKKKRTT